MSENKDIPKGNNDEQGSSRIRTTSECSYTSDDGSSGFTGRRQRTTSHQFMVASGLTAASPPKFVSLEEIMQAANGMRDMALVHQIVVDKDFRLKRAEPEPNSVQGIIKNTMHKAFWDILKQQLNENPPVYTQALNLLEEIKEGLFAVLLPQHTRIKQQISEVLDSDLIKQQAEKGTLDFKNYAQYVVSVMSKLCAPVRDNKILELSMTVDVIETFQGILETLDLMQLDMANFTLQMARPDIIACSVELERKKFADYLAVQYDGLEQTRKWLLRYINSGQAVPENVEYEKFIKGVFKWAFCQACVELIDWPSGEEYPETFMLDVDRLKDLHVRCFRLVYVATILLVTISNAGTDLQSIAAFKQSLKDHICILLENVKNESELQSTLPNISDQVLIDLKEAQKKYDLPQMPLAAESNIREQILDIGRKTDHKVKGIVQQRVKDFFLDIIESSTAAPQKVPSGLSALQKELTEIAGQFLRIVSHNSTVFCNYYFDIVAAALPKAS
ncbi:T-complex protein 11-like protein 1 [Diabrotica virgifera virgifera]|uniref:T-complex protein 11-like protein 1 n=1 Tax=Diabrotica virgifera virgifera TaxID=50390 RepID=A0A6P7FQA1_DIAVI|nr:T-complex protein 11-like protein 1 [Diabrotica virgifera virgifera]